MATQALSSASNRQIMRFIRQHEATTGKKLSKAAIDNLLRQQLEVSAARTTQSRALELQQERIDADEKFRQEQLGIQREGIEKETEAAKASGVAQVAGTALTAGILLKDTAAGKAVGSGVKSVYEGGKSLITGTTATTTPTAQAVATGAEAALPAAAPTATTAAAETIGQTTVGEIAGQTVGGATAAAGIGRLAFGQSGDSTAKDIGTIGTSALYGFYAGGPVGAVVGGVVGIAYDFLADEVGTIICAELHRQGFLDKNILEFDHQYRVENIDDETYAGYILLATPLVKWMQRSQKVTKIVKPFAMAWAYEMASRVDNNIKGNVLGKLINIIGQPICRWRAQWQTLKQLAELRP